jgi:hypothetical protein
MARKGGVQKDYSLFGCYLCSQCHYYNLGELVNACMVYVDEFCKIIELKGLGSLVLYVFKMMD